MFLHVIPDGVLCNTYHGSYKDLAPRMEWFQEQAVEYRQVVVSDDCEQDLSGLPPVEAVRGILIEYTHFPRIAARLRARYPQAFLAVRAINIEPLQHFDNCGWWPKRGPVWMLYGMWRRFRQDVLCKRRCDVVYSINEYENRIYWNRLPGAARVEWLPYFCPDYLVPATPLPFDERKTVACLPTSQKNRKSWDLVTRFIRFAEAAKAVGSPYEFLITGDLSGWDLPHSDAVKYTGMLDDLSGFLGTLTAVGLLSPLGYGFKTTILDAMAAGAHVVAHPVIAKRCPRSLAPGFIPLRTEKNRSLAEVERVLRDLESPFPLGKINQEMKCAAIDTLQRDFGRLTQHRIEYCSEVHLHRRSGT